MEKSVYENALMATAETVMAFTARGGELQSLQYCQFWADLNNPVQGSDCLASLITKLLAVATGEDKLYTLPDLMRKMVNHDFESASDQAKLTTDSMDMQQTLLGTIYFISLFYPHDTTSEALKASIARWIKLRARSPKTLDFVDECLRMLAAGYVDTNEGIISIVEQCSNIVFTDDFSIETSTMAQIAPCLINTYLRNCLRQGRQTRVIFDTVLLFLKHAKIVQEPRLLCLLHMLRSFITTCPNVDSDIIENIIHHVKQYYLWPWPYGNVARELLQLLTIELKSPGAGMREKFIEENPELERGYTPNGRERAVYLIVDHSLEKCKQFQALLQACPPEEVSISQVQMNLLANILQTSAQIDPDSLCLEFCTREDTATFYHTAIDILNKARAMDEKDAVAFRQQKLLELKDFINTRSTASKRTSVALQSQARTTSPPPLQFEFLPISSSNESPSSFETHFKYPRRSTTDTLLYILRQYAPSTERTSSCVIKVGIVGDDQTLHTMVGGYVSLKTSKPRLFDNLSFQFYLVPIAPEESRSNLASFLAKRDGWYGRHVMCMTSCILRILPTVSATDNKTDSRPKKNTWSAVDAPSVSLQLIARNYSGMAPTDLAAALESGQQALRVPLKPPSPSLLLRTELQNYFREARNMFETNIYQCECWGTDGIAYFTIPFLLRATIGIQAAAKAFMLSNGITERLSVEELQSKVKAFKWTPINLGLKFIQMNVFGAPRQGPPMEFRSYNEVVVANVPARGDRFIAPDPTKSWLEMYAQEADAKKRKARTAEEHTYHVSTLEVEAKDLKKESFHVIIDDNLYGPFSKIKIGPCLISKEPMICHTLPLMTYLPVVL